VRNSKHLYERKKLIQAHIHTIVIGDQMPKKRKNRGRNKGGKGKEPRVHCDGCGALIPRSKAIKVTRRMSLIDPQLERELRNQGALIPTYKVTKYLCVNCAIFQGVIKIRPREERKRRVPLGRAS